MNHVVSASHSTISSHALARLLAENFVLGSSLACKLLKIGVNDTYYVKTEKAKYILRVYKHGWRTLSEIFYEIDVLQELICSGLNVSAPIPDKDGNTVLSLAAPEGERFAVLFTYAEVKTLEIKSSDQCSAFGKSVAQIHQFTDSFKSNHERFQLDTVHLLDDPLTAIEPHLKHRPDDWQYIFNSAEMLKERIKNTSEKGLEWGFCHGDFHGGNAHLMGDVWTHFDFDCGGAGWRSYDIAVFRWALTIRKMPKDEVNRLWESFLNGYLSQRSLSDIDIQAIPLFVAARQLWLMGLHTGDKGNWYFSDDKIEQYLGVFRSLMTTLEAKD